MEGWVGLVGWPIADALPTKWSHINHGSGVDQGKSTSYRPTFLPVMLSAWLSLVGGLSLLWAQSTVNRWLLCWLDVCYGSDNQANSAFHPSGVGKWVVIYVFTRIMEVGTWKNGKLWLGATVWQQRSKSVSAGFWMLRPRLKRRPCLWRQRRWRQMRHFISDPYHCLLCLLYQRQLLSRTTATKQTG